MSEKPKDKPTIRKNLDQATAAINKKAAEVSKTLRGYKDKTVKFGGKISKGIVEAIEKPEREEKEHHDYLLKHLRISKARGKHKLVIIMAGSISDQISKTKDLYPNLYSESEIAETKAALKTAVKKDPAFAVRMRNIYTVDHNSLDTTSLFGSEVFNSIALEKIISYVLSPSEISGEGYDMLRFDELNKLLEYGKKNNVPINLNEVSKLAQVCVETYLEKAITKIDGGAYDYFVFRGLWDILEETAIAGLTINLAPLNQLGKKIVEKHKQKAITKAPYYHENYLQDLLKAAKEAGLEL